MFSNADSMSLSVGHLSKVNDKFFLNNYSIDPVTRWVKLYRNCWFFDRKPILHHRTIINSIHPCDIELGPFERDLKTTFEYWQDYCRKNNFVIGGRLRINRIDDYRKKLLAELETIRYDDRERAQG